MFEQHKELCQLPSKLFYEEKLETADKVLNRTPDKIQWPGWNIYPFQFYHVEGTEKSLIVSTKQGNENSKKNEKEIAKVVSGVLQKLTIEIWEIRFCKLYVPNNCAN